MAASPATTGQRPGDDFEAPTSPEERLTLLDLVAGVQDAAESDAEVTSTLRHMFETGRVRLDSLSVQEHPWGAKPLCPQVALAEDQVALLKSNISKPAKSS